MEAGLWGIWAFRLNAKSVSYVLSMWYSSSSPPFRTILRGLLVLFLFKDWVVQRLGYSERHPIARRSADGDDYVSRRGAVRHRNQDARRAPADRSSNRSVKRDHARALSGAEVRA